MSICEKTELDTIMCAHCLGHSDEPTTDGLSITFTMNSRYPGRCALNGKHSIEVGDLIGVANESNGDELGWVCASCTQRAGDEG